MIQGIEQQIKRIMDYTATQKMPKAIRRSIIQPLPLQPAERTTLSHKTIRKALTQDVRSKMNPRQGQTGDVQVIKNNSKGERVTVFVPPTLMFTSIQAHAWRHQCQITTKHHKRVIRSREWRLSRIYQRHVSPGEFQQIIKARNHRKSGIPQHMLMKYFIFISLKAKYINSKL